MLKKVLSVEDDDITQMLTEMVLLDAGFCDQVIKVYNGEEALDFFKHLPLEESPMLILLDLNMPVMGGWEFLESFSKNYPQFLNKTKIYVLSSSINPNNIDKAKAEMSISGFLSKPLDDEQIVQLKSTFGF